MREMMVELESDIQEIIANTNLAEELFYSNTPRIEETVGECHRFVFENPDGHKVVLTPQFMGTLGKDGEIEAQIPIGAWWLEN